jgi:transposase
LKRTLRNCFANRDLQTSWRSAGYDRGWLLPEIPEVTMSRIRRPYPSDLSDTEWVLLEPLLASFERRGRPAKWPMRRIGDAVFYLLRSGCAWRMLPREYPPWQTLYYHFRKWRLDGRLRQAHDRLRAARCAKRKVGLAIPVEQSWTAKL